MMERARESLSHWLADYWKVALLVLGLGTIFIAAGFWITRDLDEPAMDDQGEIVRFGAYGDKFGPIPVIQVRLRDGREVQLHVNRSQTGNCRVGSMIGLKRRGTLITVDSRGCTARAP